MKNIHVYLIGLLVGLMACEPEEIVEDYPCVEDKIEELSDLTSGESLQIYSYTFEGETVFLFPERCCDFPSEVYDSDCNFICSPSGGIAGTGDGQCSDFFENATDKKLVWKSGDADCASPAEINKQKFNDASEQYGSIIDAFIDEDCLYIEFGASGCSGDSWTWDLLDSGDIAESFPVQRSIKFFLKNEEACQAYFTKEVGFDISVLQIEDTEIVKLNLDNFGQLTYEY